MQIPERQAGRETLLVLQRDGGRQFQEAEVGDVVIGSGTVALFFASGICGVRSGAQPHADEFDLRDDEAVAARVFAHVAMDVREPGEVFDAPLAHFVAHARVPAIKGLDDADDAAAAITRQRLLEVVLVVGQEVRAVTAFVGGAHREVVWGSNGGFEGGADFWDEEGGVDVLEGGFGRWMKM